MNPSLPTPSFEKSINVVMILLALVPLVLTFSAWLAPVGTLLTFGVIFMYLGYVLIFFVPIIGVVAAATIFACGAIMVAIGAGLDAVLKTLERQPRWNAGEMVRALRERPPEEEAP